MKNFFIVMSILVVLALCFTSCDMGLSGQNGDEIKKPEPPTAPRKFYSKDVSDWMSSASGSDTMKVVIALRDDTWQMESGLLEDEFDFTVFNVDGTVEVYASETRGRAISSEELETRQARRMQIEQDLFNQRKDVRRQNYDILAGRMQWLTRNGTDDPDVDNLYTTVIKTLPKSEINKLVANADIILGVEQYQDDKDTIDSALRDMRLSDIAHPRGHDGDDIGIYIREANGTHSPNENVNGFDANLFTLINNTPSAHSTHATNVGICLHQAAPDAHIYCSGEDFVPGSPSSYSPPIFVANHSWSRAVDGKYTASDRNFDNYVYNNRTAIFIAAGNNGDPGEKKYVTTPAVAYNVFAIGAYNDVTDAMAGFSSYKDPETRCEKPELVAPGVSLRLGTRTIGNGTSYASPLAAGFGACLIDAYGDRFRNRPYYLKAYLMAGTSHNIEGSTRLSEYDGAGAVNFFNAAYNGNGWRWDGANGAFFNSNEEVKVRAPLTKGTRYRVALSYLVTGDYVYSNKKPNMDLDLYVKYNGSTQNSSVSLRNNFEIVDFTASYTGTHELVIKRYSNSGVGRVVMALCLKRI